MGKKMNMTIAEAHRAMKEGELSAERLAGNFLAAIREKNDTIGAYLEVWEESAMEDARRADEMFQEGRATAMTGIPVALKDNILSEGKEVSAASRILKGYRAPYDAHVVRLLRSAGAVFLGRVNMDEFAMGSSTENSAFGITRNPHDEDRVPGGSSGGSAAAVAAGMALCALGSDTGGSIRQPAAFCGVVGFKPTYGAVSRRGLIAMGSSLDQIGPLAKTVADAETLFFAIAGHDEKDATSVAWAEERINRFNPKEKLTIGVPRDFVEAEGVDKDVVERFNAVLSALREKGHEVKDISLPNLRHALAAYYIIMPAESSTNLARFDGVRYGTRSEGESGIGDYMRTRGEGFGKEVRRRILLGTFVLSAGYKDAYYEKAMRVRDAIRGDFEDAFRAVDVIATPTTPSPAFRIGEKTKDPLAMYAADMFTVPANLAGIPALSVPCGSAIRDGKKLPLGIHLAAPHFGEKALFFAGKEVEKLSS